MRYIYYIVLILALVSAVTFFKLSKPPDEKAALIVNDRIITMDEFHRAFDAQPRHLRDEENCVNHLITKELLIQESMKEGIDREESFRRSIQNFYEQSLIKLLMDKKFASLNISVSDEEAEKYLSFLGSTLHLSFFSFSDLASAKRGSYADGESKTEFFDALSEDMKHSIIWLKEGDLTEPVPTGKNFIVARLDKIERPLQGTRAIVDRDKIKTRLLEEKKSKIMDNWIADLKKNASIQVCLDENK